MNINRIENATLAKLNRDEIGVLGLLNCGVITYMGELKSRRNGWKTETTKDQVNFIGTKQRVEFIRIEKLSDRPEWAMRVYDLVEEQYWTVVHPLTGLDFMK